jgi:hypothetical protein
VFVPNKVHVLSPAAQAVVGGVAGGGAASGPRAGVRGRAAAPAPAPAAAPAAASPAPATRTRAAAAPAPAQAAAPAGPGPGQATPYESCTPEVQAKVVAYFEKVANDPNQDGNTFGRLLVSSVSEPAIRATIKTLHPIGGTLYTDQDGTVLASLGFGLFDDGAGGMVVSYLS